jgi:hypothetical protein
LFEFSICKLSLSLQFGHFFQMVQESLMIIYHKTTSTIAWQKEVCFSKLLLREVLAFDNQNNDWYPWSRTPPHSNIGQRARSNIVTSGVKTSREQRQNILAGLKLFSHTSSSRYPRLIRMPRRECWQSRPAEQVVLGNNRLF